MHTQEQLERLNQQKKETESELRVKENELKRMKYQIINEGSEPQKLSKSTTNRQATQHSKA